MIAGIGVGTTVGLLLRRTVGPALATIGATAICAAGRMLDEEALRIGALVERGDLDGARAEVRSLVGRRADELDEAGLSRAIVESIAENSVDAVTASLFWATRRGRPRRPGPPGGQHARCHGRPPRRPLRALRVGQRPAGRPRELRAGPAHRTGRRLCHGQVPRRRSGASCDATPPRTRHRTAGWWRRRSPPRSASGWEARTATATSSRIGAPSVTAGLPGRATSRRPCGSAATPRSRSPLPPSGSSSSFTPRAGAAGRCRTSSPSAGAPRGASGRWTRRPRPRSRTRAARRVCRGTRPSRCRSPGRRAS